MGRQGLEIRDFYNETSNSIRKGKREVQVGAETGVHSLCGNNQ